MAEVEITWEAGTSKWIDLVGFLYYLLTVENRCKNNQNHGGVKFQVPTRVNLKITFFWDTNSRSLTEK
jgi:hypothetical protein